MKVIFKTVIFTFFVCAANAGTVSWIGNGEVRLDIYKNERYDGHLHLNAGQKETTNLPVHKGKTNWTIVNAQSRYKICYLTIDHRINQDIYVSPYGCSKQAP